MSSPVFGSDDHLFFSEDVTSGLDSAQPEGQSLLGVTWGAGLEHRYHPDWGMGQATLPMAWAARCVGLTTLGGWVGLFLPPSCQGKDVCYENTCVMKRSLCEEGKKGGGWRCHVGCGHRLK